jgi:hypothetical protein
MVLLLQHFAWRLARRTKGFVFDIRCLIWRGSWIDVEYLFSIGHRCKIGKRLREICKGSDVTELTVPQSWSKIPYRLEHEKGSTLIQGKFP